MHTHIFFPFQFYLNMHKFGNAETSELWEALQSRVRVLHVCVYGVCSAVGIL